MGLKKLQAPLRIEGMRSLGPGSIVYTSVTSPIENVDRPLFIMIDLLACVGSEKRLHSLDSLMTHQNMEGGGEVTA
jgi:hypothetical protein